MVEAANDRDGRYYRQKVKVAEEFAQQDADGKSGRIVHRQSFATLCDLDGVCDVFGGVVCDGELFRKELFGDAEGRVATEGQRNRIEVEQ